MMKQKSLNIFNTGGGFSASTSYSSFSDGLRKPTTAAPKKERQSQNMSLLSLNSRDSKVYKPKNNNIFDLDDSNRPVQQNRSIKKYNEPNSKRVVDSSLIDDTSTYERQRPPSAGGNTSFSYLFARSESGFGRKPTNPKCYRSNIFDDGSSHYETPKRLLK
jgi:hypothetical protein